MAASVFPILFFLSGIAGLIYESIWSHYLKLFLGHAAYAQTLVLAIYMGGMALGAWFAGNHIKNNGKKLLVKFALIEISLGVFAFIFHSVFIIYQNLSLNIILPHLKSGIFVFFYKWLTSALIILPESILLGATFPLMIAGYIRRFGGNSGYKISKLYFTNTFGASIGVLLSGFLLIEKTGLHGTLITAGVIDVFVGIVILLLSNTPSHKNVPEENIKTNVISVSLKEFDLKKHRFLFRVLIVVSGITAVSSFMYELGWIRMLSLVLGSSTHSFEMMLSTFILGIALGSFIIRKRIDSINIPKALIVSQAAMGMFSLASVLLYGKMFHLMQFFMSALEKNSHGYFFFNLSCDLICMLVMLPATICAGMVLPLVTQFIYANYSGDKHIGLIYSVNTFGGIIGILLSIWLLMPLAGVRFLVSFGAILDMGIAILLIRIFNIPPESPLKRFLPGVCVSMIVFSVSLGRIDPALAASGVFRNGTIARNIRMLSHKDGRTATISLYRNNDNIVISTNGKPDAGINVHGGVCGDEYTMALLGVVPLSMIPDNSSAAIIGLGSGMTSHFMLHDTTLSHLDIIEIEPFMVRAAEKIGNKVSKTFNDTRAHIHIDDAKSFFSTCGNRYDVIISEPSNPWVSGVSGLYSKEFFSQIKKHLADDGILVQWFHRYESDISIVTSFFGALEEHFIKYDVYCAGSDYIVIARNNNLKPPRPKRDIFRFSKLSKEMSKLGFTSLSDLDALRMFSDKTMCLLLDIFPSPSNSDFAPFIDLNAVKYRFIDEYIKEFDTLYNYILPVRKIIEGDTCSLPYNIDIKTPDLSNLASLYDAKKLYHEITDTENCYQNPDFERSSVILLLDYISLSPSCTTFDITFSTIVEILQKTLPWLSSEEMASIWNAIEIKCAPVIVTENDRLWMDFFSSLCRYDLKSLQELSSRLLPYTGPIEDDYINEMLLSTLCLTSSFLGNDIDASFYNRFEKRNNPGMILQMCRLWEKQ